MTLVDHCAGRFAKGTVASGMCISRAVHKLQTVLGPRSIGCMSLSVQTWTCLLVLWNRHVRPTTIEYISQQVLLQYLSVNLGR